MISDSRPKYLLSAFVLAGVAMLAAVYLLRDRIWSGDSGLPEVHFASHAPVFNGTLRVSFYNSLAHTTQPQRHRSVFVNGADYDGMEDNDLRGMLDGTFQWGWNQPGQIHVRIGRRGRSLFYGEFEIYRVLHRWSEIRLPPLARVVSAKLIVRPEKGVETPTRLMLYEVKRDWNPGAGGTYNDNISPPRDGEAWWNDARFNEESWGLPGVGFASDSDPNADTGEMPLAEAEILPGDSTVVLTSARLAAYAERRATEGEPLLFLLKLADYQEDTPGTVVEFYSGNHGDSRNSARRPRLVLEWESSSEVQSWERDISLEYGRTYSMKQMQTLGASFVSVSIIGEDDGEMPTLEVNGGINRMAGTLTTAAQHVIEPWNWVQVTLVAGHDPVILGQPFEAELKNTWVRTAPPEEQVVPWTFVSPSGKSTLVLAQYEGENRWTVEFKPDELGPWQYTWSENFVETQYESASGHFDLLAGGIDNVQRELAHLAEEIEAHDVQFDEHWQLMMVQFYRLERRAMQLVTPEEFRSESGRELKDLLNRVRAALHEAVPDSIPMVRSP
jgi:hypothetical protein